MSVVRLSLLVIVAGAIILTAAGLAWRNMPNRREYPADGRHAPRGITNNRSRR